MPVDFADRRFQGSCPTAHDSNFQSLLHQPGNGRVLQDVRRDTRQPGRLACFFEGGLDAFDQLAVVLDHMVGLAALVGCLQVGQQSVG